jgi:hypothetical protein
MSLRDMDWPHLRQGLLGPAVLLLACTVLWGTTTVYGSRAGAILEAERQSLASLEAERNDLRQRREAQRKYARLFDELSMAGVIGPEPRLAWIQATRDAAHDLGLPYLRYTTGPQRPFEAAWLVPGVAATVLASPLDLQLGLVHEGELLALMDRLRLAPGLMQVQSCSLELMDSDTPPEPGRANINGSCQLHMYSIPREATVVAAANPES